MSALAVDDGIVATIVNPPQIWHLARLAAFREAIDRLPEALTDTAVEAYRNDLRRCVEQAWREYVEQVAMSPAERSGFLNLGAPTHITLNPEEGAPVAHWNGNNPALAGIIGELVIPGEAATGTPPYPLSDPFRPVDLKALPEGTRHFPLSDSRHTAIAAVTELCTLLDRDISRIIDNVESGHAWRNLVRHASTLKLAATETLNLLPKDHFRNWDTTLPRISNLPAAPQAVDQRAATTVAQQRIALHYVAQCFADVINRVEARYPHDADLRCTAALTEVRACLSLLRQALDGMNAGAATQLQMRLEDVVAMVIFRATGHSQPVFVAIPSHAVAAPVPMPSPDC